MTSYRTPNNRNFLSRCLDKLGDISLLCRVALRGIWNLFYSPSFNQK